MITIKFSAKYSKMPPSFDNMHTYLTGVDLVKLEDLDPDFLMKDTEIVGEGHYFLPSKGKYMILWLFSTDWSAIHRWQTIRRWTPSKEEYYRSHINEAVNIQIQKGEEDK